jgi:uncharacterized membrane protein YjjP (DUF1212 family)
MKPVFSVLEGQRKYSVFWAVFLMASFFLAVDILSGDQWVTVVGAVVAGYMVGNVGEHWTKRKEMKPEL